ncbi:hypothetical protein [Burkholderia gladioli]|uniref:hypothetical protein n=1 Tax=Burkholderia gladioli TaxID=28095 RepID=UPI0016411344|nr:hypothetical protein [Burkholderia gladioli]
MRRPLTELQRAFIDLCIAHAKFEIVDAMSISLVSADVNSYNAVAVETHLNRFGFCTPAMVERGKSLFHDELGRPPGSGFDDAYEMVCTALDEWLRTFVMPVGQVSFPPLPRDDDGRAYLGEGDCIDEEPLPSKEL